MDQVFDRRELEAPVDREIVVLVVDVEIVRRKERTREIRRR